MDAWAADAFKKWYGDKPRPPHFAGAVDAARRGESAAEEQLAELADNRRLPDLVRATAGLEMGRFDTRDRFERAAGLLEDSSAQVRATAAANLQGAPPAQLRKWLTPLLNDPVRLVRTEAARTLAETPLNDLRGLHRDAPPSPQPKNLNPKK